MQLDHESRPPMAVRFMNYIRESVNVDILRKQVLRSQLPPFRIDCKFYRQYPYALHCTESGRFL